MKIMKHLFAFFLITFLCVSSAWAGGSLLLKNARLIDGTGTPIQEGMSVLILDGRIAKIGRDFSSRGVRELDVQGSYVLPGIIDAHVHLMRGAAVAKNKYDVPVNVKMWADTWGKNIDTYLRAYLACGVTTVLDAGAPAFVIKYIREHLSKDNPGPRFLALGPLISPPKGYWTYAFNPSVSSIEEVEAKLHELKSLGVVGIKVPIEKGYNPFSPLPVHSREIMEALKTGAAKRKLPVYFHATIDDAFNTALDMEAHALMHTYILRRKEDRRLSKTFVERMVQTKTYQVSTLSVMDAELMSYDLERLNEPLLAITVPEDELSTAKSAQAAYTIRKMHINQGAPWVMRPFAGLFMNALYGRANIDMSLKKSREAISDLNKVGVKIVMGSDTVYLDYAVYSFHGFTSLREMELLGEAGLTPQEAIRAATVNAAEMIGLQREIGTVEVGKRADLVVLKENPLANLRAFRTVQWTVKDGIAKTPQEWMAR